MTIASEITRIQNNIAAAYTAARSKGATMPATENSDNLATCIASISTVVSNVNLTFTVENEKEVVSLIVNGTTYTSNDFNDDVLTLVFPLNTSITWSITLNRLIPDPGQGNFIITSDTTIHIDFSK